MTRRKDHPDTSVPGDRGLSAALTDRLRQTFPGAAAIILKGSHVRGDAGPHSDIDFDVLVSGDPVEAYPVWFDTDRSGRMRHISVAVKDLDGWLADADKPEPWAFGLPVREATQLLWAASDDLRERLDRPWRQHPPADPELEDFVEGLGKTRNALDRGDSLGLRLAAQTLAHYAPTLLRPLNRDVFASTPREALGLVLDFEISPVGYRDDLLACLGMSGRAVSDGEVFDAASRLVTGTLTLLREHEAVIVPLLAGDLAAHLRDGSLMRYARQTAATR